jgi:hypothetical protein
MKAKNKLLSEGGAKALIFICSGLLLLLLVVYPTVTACSCAGTIGIIVLSKVKGKDNLTKDGGLVAALGLPVVVGFLIHPGVYVLVAFLSWSLMVGLACSGAIERAVRKNQ